MIGPLRKDSVMRARRLKKLVENFTPCLSPRCYCYDLIMRPEKTKITPTLINNANWCKDQYLKRLIERNEIK